MTDGRRLLVLAIALLAACKSDNNASCSLDGGTQLAMTAWPKFRADAVNSGRALQANLTDNPGVGALLFDGSCIAGSTQTAQTCTVDEANRCPSGQTCQPIGPVSTTPILGPETTEPPCMGPQSIYVAAADGNVYIYCNGQPVQVMDPIRVQSAITGSPLLGVDGTLFVPSNGQLTQFHDDGTFKNFAPVLGFVAASPNIWTDGTVFVGTQSGSFTGICPNGVARYAVTAPATQSTAALVQDPNFPMQDTPIIVVGGLNGQVRAYSIRGRQYWSFFASANIVAAVLIDATTGLAYVADAGGHVFAVNLVVDTANGQLDPDFAFTAAAGITASPALGRDDDSTDPPTPGTTLYVADQSGVLYAVNRATPQCAQGCAGTVRWTFQADGPISSSPAVATVQTDDMQNLDAIVFAADIVTVLPNVGPVAIGGRVYAIRDDGDHATPLWTFDPASIDPQGRSYSFGASSPSIGPDGTVYIGRTGSRLGGSGECPTAEPCVVNAGGALYAIGP